MPEQEVAPDNSERRVVTILFADVSGFTSMSERLEPETVTELMNACFEAMGRIVKGHGGIIDKFIGDCAMILFGAPRSLEHAPLEALAAALEIRAAIDRINSERKPAVPISVHVGINTGTVVAGEVGTSERKSYTVMGDPVNLASRLKDLAARGEVLVGHDTWLEGRRRFDFGPVRRVEVKGKAGPVEAWELTGRKQATEMASPFMGRGPELRALELGALQAEAGKGSIILVLGEPGIGKSRLVSELLAGRSSAGSRHLAARCQLRGMGLPYRPFIDLLRDWLGVGENTDAGTAFDALAEALSLLAPGEGARGLLPYIASLLGLESPLVADRPAAKSDAEAFANMMRRSFRDLVRLVSGSKPLLLVLEDLHWIDDASADLLEGLLPLAEDRPICILLTAREELSEGGRRVVEAARRKHAAFFRELRLEALSREEGRGLLEAISSASVSPSARALVLDRSGGNPYFIEEVLRSLADSGDQVPSTIQEVLAARIDSLDPDAKEVLRVVSVFGRSAPLAVLIETARKLGKPDAGRWVEQGMAVLEDAHLASIAIERGEAFVRFRHALAQEVAYGTILAPHRREIHGAVAASLETLHPERLPGLSGILARHSVEAGDFDKAEAYMAMAGEEAARSAAPSEVLTHYRQALELYVARTGTSADPATIDRFSVGIGRALYLKGRYEEALPYYEAALAYRGYSLDDRARWAGFRALRGLVRLILWSGGSGSGRAVRAGPAELEAAALGLEDLRVVSKARQRSFSAKAFLLADRLMRLDFSGFDAGMEFLLGAASALSMSGRSARIARRILSRLEPMVHEGQGHCRALFDANFLSACSMERGGWARAAALGLESCDEALERGEVFAPFHAYFIAATLRLEQGDLAGYSGLAARLSGAAEAFDNDDGRNLAWMLETRRILKMRDAAAASAALPRLAAFYEGAGIGDLALANVLCFSLREAVFRGDLPKAESELERLRASLQAGARKGGRSSGSLLTDAIGLVSIATVFEAKARASRGRMAHADARNYAAVVSRLLSVSSRYLPDRVEALRLAGNRAWILGRKSRALSFWRAAIREGEGLGARIELAHTFHDAGEALGGSAPGPDWRARATGAYADIGTPPSLTRA